MAKMGWRAGDEEQLRKAVRNFNDKISRILRRDPSAREYLPTRKSLKAEREKAQLGTRKEFSRQIRETRKFGEKGAEKQVRNQLGLNVTQWEVAKAKELVRRENIRRAQRRKVISTDVKQGLAREEEIALQNPKKLNLETKTPKSFQMFVGALEERLSERYKAGGYDQYKRNYIDAINKNIPGMYAQMVLKIVVPMNARKLHNLTMNHPELQIDFIYGMEEAEAKADRMLEVFEANM